MLKKLFIFLVFLISLLCSTALAYTVDDIEWNDDAAKSGTLYWGDTFTLDDYTIRAEDFNTDGFVSISISRNGQVKNISPLKVGDSLKHLDTEKGEDIRVFIDSVTLNIDEWTGNMEDPRASVKVYKRAIPEMDIEITTEEDTYDPRDMAYKYIETTIDIKNEGDAKAFEMDVEIDPAGMELASGKLKHHFISIEEDEVLEPIVVKFKIPEYWEETDVDIIVTTKSLDVNDEINVDSEKKTLAIEPVVELIVTKTITEDIYMDETAHVSVSIWNDGIYGVNSVTVTNPVLGDMELQDSVNQEAKVSFSAGETKAKLFEYTMKPVKTGTFKVPVATATFTDPEGKVRTFKSETPSIEITGPNIVLTKTVSSETVSPGDEVTVNVAIANKGTVRVSVTASETLPDTVAFVSGDLNFKEILTKGQTLSYSYVVKMNEAGDIRLPATTSTFIDFEDFKGEKISNMPVISVVEPEEISAEFTDDPDSTSSSSSSGSSSSPSSSDGNEYSEDQERVQPGFEGTTLIFVLLCVYVVYGRRRRQ
ncbi:BatD family protein [Methanolobus sp. ZRKC2]|uniref:BatD family protein n=1 Tax=Methanolobus sp. ZRKC2 TaxID=3125783 RepID=UPI00324DC08B